MEERTLSKEAQQLQFLLEQENQRQQRQKILASAKKNSSVTFKDISPNVNELNSWMNHQKSVEEQLQEQVHFYQDALENLRLKSEEITNENARLYDEMRKNALKQSYFSSSSEDEKSAHSIIMKPKERLLQRKGEFSPRDRQSERENEEKITNQAVKHVPSNMAGMKKMYDLKTKHLEGLLKSSREVIDKQQGEIDSLRSEIRMFKTPVREKSKWLGEEFKDYTGQEISSILPRLSREKEELLESNKKLSSLLNDSKKREGEACEKVKSSCELVQQANLEKQQVTVLLKQTQKDLEDLKTKYHKMEEKFHVEKTRETEQLKQEHKQTIEKLHQKIEDASVATNSFEAQMEKLTREKVSLKAEIEKEKVDSAKKQADSSKFIDKSRNDLVEAFKENTLLQQELQQYKFDMQLKLKQKQQEVDGLVVELKEAKRRYQLIEQTLQENQHELLDTTNTLNHTKQKLQTETLQHNLVIQKYEDNIKTMTFHFQQKEQEFALILQEANKQHLNSKEEFGKLLESQSRLVNNYKSECESLGKVLEEKKKHDVENKKLEEVYYETKMLLEDTNTKLEEKEKYIELVEKQLTDLHSVEQDLQEQVMILMNKQNSILRDRHLLSKEVEMLRAQVKRD